MARKALFTEDLGKITEKALCDLLCTPYNMKFGYSQDRVDAIIPRINCLKEEFSGFVHTGHMDNLHDFTSADNSEYLSVKTNKKGYKICPQIIGQPARSTFCRHFHLPFDALNHQIKDYIQQNVRAILAEYMKYTFHCKVLYYNEKLSELKIIILISQPNWNKYPVEFSHIIKKKEWNESTTIYLKVTEEKHITLGEFQIHNHRDGIKFRFDLKGILACFPESFAVRNI